MRQITPGNAGITPDSPTVCCPPDRLVTATRSHICCPPGSVHQPNGGLSTQGGLCCTAGNVCGQQCCDSLPSFPQKCVDGTCHFDLARMDSMQAKANAHGDVPLTLSFSGPANGTLTLEVTGSGPAADIAALRKPVILGTTAFHVHRKGTVRLTVQLNSVGRRRLSQSHRIHAAAVITFSKHGKSASTSAPLTLKG